MKKVERVETPAGVFLVWAEGRTLHCQAETPQGPREIAYWNELPEGARPAVAEAVRSLQPPPMVPTSANSQGGYFKFELHQLS